MINFCPKIIVNTCLLSKLSFVVRIKLFSSRSQQATSVHPTCSFIVSVLWLVVLFPQVSGKCLVVVSIRLQVFLCAPPVHQVHSEWPLKSWDCIADGYSGFVVISHLDSPNCVSSTEPAVISCGFRFPFNITNYS